MFKILLKASRDCAYRWNRVLLMVRRVAQGMRIEASSRIAIARAQRSVGRKIAKQRSKGRK